MSFLLVLSVVNFVVAVAIRVVLPGLEKPDISV